MYSSDPRSQRSHPMILRSKSCTSDVGVLKGRSPADKPSNISVRSPQKPHQSFQEEKDDVAASYARRHGIPGGKLKFQNVCAIDGVFPEQLNESTADATLLNEIYDNSQQEVILNQKKLVSDIVSLPFNEHLRRVASTLKYGFNSTTGII